MAHPHAPLPISILERTCQNVKRNLAVRGYILPAPTRVFTLQLACVRARTYTHIGRQAGRETPLAMTPSSLPSSLPTFDVLLPGLHYGPP